MRVVRRIAVLGLFAGGCITSLSAQPPSDVQRFAQQVAKSIVNGHHSRVLIAYSPYCSSNISACVDIESALRAAIRQSMQNVELVDETKVWAAVGKRGLDVIDVNSGAALKDTNPDLSFDTLVLVSAVPQGTASSSGSVLLPRNPIIEINCSVFDVPTSQFIAEYDIDLDLPTSPKSRVSATTAGHIYMALPKGTISINSAAVPPGSRSCQPDPGIGEGSLIAMVTITVQGRIENVTVVNSKLKGDLTKAIHAFATCQFIPAKDKEGKPVAVVTPFELAFRNH
jgi:hypothetical protein